MAPSRNKTRSLFLNSELRHTFHSHFTRISLVFFSLFTRVSFTIHSNLTRISLAIHLHLLTLLAAADLGASGEALGAGALGLVVAGPAFGVEPAGAGGTHAPTLGLLAPELVAALEVTGGV